MDFSITNQLMSKLSLNFIQRLLDIINESRQYLKACNDCLTNSDENQRYRPITLYSGKKAFKVSDLQAISVTIRLINDMPCN